jgi:hypothetical protein
MREEQGGRVSVQTIGKKDGDSKLADVGHTYLTYGYERNTKKQVERIRKQDN